MDYRSIIESKYNRESWQALLHDIFKTGANFRTTPIVVDCNSPLAASSVQLGTITLADDNKIAVYEIKLAENVDIVANRVGIRNLLISNWKMQGCVGAFMFCYRDNESVLRFSYVSSTFKFNDEGKMEKDETDTKRFTYLLGAGHRSRTAIKQFEDLRNSKLMLADITKAFSIEALSDSFFKEYKDNYENIIEYITGKRMVKVANKWEEQVKHAPNEAIMTEFSWFDDPEKAVRDYVKKLMGRIVFLQFIQKKGWLGVPVGKEWGEGDKEYLQNLYDHSQSKDNFIDGILELLFNDINTKRENDIANPILGHGIKMPYLNGGLFEQDKADECTFRLPKKYLDDLFKFFSSYNFTIDENDPDDAEIGVDPEMLGRIFENLLEDNKDKGAFYTPKEIVQYMCRESLIAYLQTGKEDSDKEAIRAFVTTYNKDCLNEALSNEVDEKLKTVKICDPAIGSGAFPMGLLKELFACRSAIEGLSDDNAAEIKKHIIQNNIYGVDIEKGAVDIARLRFWLAIIVDEKTPHALPNMDFKIMQGNSLIPTFDGKYVNLSDKLRHVNSSKIRDAKKELSRLQSSFYNSEGEEKKELLVKIKYQILEIVKLQMDYEYRAEVERSAQMFDLFNTEIKRVVVDDEKAKIVGQCIRLQQQLQSSAKSLNEKTEIAIPFFDWKIMFSDVFQDSINSDPGFDICIGNPPYIQLQSNDGLLGKMYADIGFKSFASTGDIYCLFYEKGWQLLNRNGKLCYITSNKWMRAGYGSKLRDFFVTYTTPMQLIDFAGVKIFENATVDTNILLLSREKAEDVQTQAAIIPSKDVLSKLSDYVQQHHNLCNFSNDDSWVILSDIEQSIKRKIESAGTPLKDWDINIYRGVLTGFNDAFVITTERRDEILAACKTDKERMMTASIIRPILRGRDIKRYGHEWSDLWLINTHNGVKGRIPRINIEDFPSIKAHLDMFWDKIKNRADKGDTPYNLRNCAYLEDFDKPKIMYPNMTKYIPFYYDEMKFIQNDKSFMITGKNIAFLTAFLNSSIFKFCFIDNFPELQGGTRELRKIFFDKIPVLQVSEKENEMFENLVRNIQKSYSRDVAKEIDEHIFDLYGLSQDERETIGFIEIQ